MGPVLSNQGAVESPALFTFDPSVSLGFFQPVGGRVSGRSVELLRRITSFEFQKENTGVLKQLTTRLKAWMDETNFVHRLGSKT